MAPEFPQNANWNELRDIFFRAADASPRKYNEYLRANRFKGYENSPFYEMVTSSPMLDYVRQGLPQNVANTEWHQRWMQQLPGADAGSPPGAQRVRAITEKIGQVPLGGYDAAQQSAYRSARIKDPELRMETLQRGMAPISGSSATEVPIGKNLRPKVAQAAGAAVADVSQDGLRNIWWFLNAPQAVASIAMLQGMHSAQMGDENLKSVIGNKPLLTRRNMRLAATLPAIIGMSAAVGNIGRPAGYKTVLPSREDPRKTNAPVAEGISRYFLGRTGRLLPYDEFVKERPDVSRDEYQRYKAYLFNQKTDLNPLDGDINLLGAMRATTQGIHGPEINFMGKTIPVATGILPAVAAVAGGRYGIRRAAQKLTDRPKGGGASKLESLNKLKQEVAVMNTQRPKIDPNSEVYKSTLEKSVALDKEVQREALKQALIYSSLGLTSAAAAGQTVESIRRAID